MPRQTSQPASAYESLSEARLVALARAGDAGAFRQIMTRFNQRLFRIARSVIRDDAEAEDVLQEAYTRAFSGFSAFRGDSGLFTWLVSITLNEARGRLRRRRPMVDLHEIEAAQERGAEILIFPSQTRTANPEEEAARAQIRNLLELAIDNLPEAFRIVFIMREIDGCSVESTAEALGLRPETVKTRLFRARKLLRANLDETFSTALTETFPFLGARCTRVTDDVIRRIAPVYGWQTEPR